MFNIEQKIVRIAPIVEQFNLPDYFDTNALKIMVYALSYAWKSNWTYGRK